MFCHECGCELSDGAKFCQKCGTKVVYVNMEQQIPSQAQNSSENIALKGKSKKWLIIPVVAVIVIALIIFMMNIGDGTDYVATVVRHKPFEVRKLSYTYEDVLNTYISNPEWKAVHESGDVVYVDISGKIKGMDSDLVVSIKAIHDSDDSRLMLMTPESVNIDGLTFTDSDAVEFLYVMFKAYDEKENDLSQLLELIKLLYATGEMDFSEIYTNEIEGISFKYPAGWVLIDPTKYNSEDTLGTAVVGLLNEKEYSDIFNSVMTVEKYPSTPQQVDELFINNQEYAAKYLDDDSVIETSVVELNGIPARKTIYIDSDHYGHRYLYNVGTNVYRVEFGCEKDYAERYERVFDAIMDSYIITGVPLADSDLEVDIPYGYEEDASEGSILEGNYTDYREWGGNYYDGWLDTTLTLSLYSDGTQAPECGYITTYFRGMENPGKLYYLGGNEFRWESE